MRIPSSAPSRRFAVRLLALSLFLCILAIPLVKAAAQENGTVIGTVTRAEGGRARQRVGQRGGTGISTITSPDGRYTLRRVPSGAQTIVFRWLGYRPTEVHVSWRRVAPYGGRRDGSGGRLAERDRGRRRLPRPGADRGGTGGDLGGPAPSSLQAAAITGQAPLALQATPGVDVVQSGVNDFNVNSRGFNSSLNRRMLVLQDGRDLAIAFLGSQEWNGMTQPLEDMGRWRWSAAPGRPCTAPTPSAASSTSPRLTAREQLGGHR